MKGAVGVRVVCKFTLCSGSWFKSEDVGADCVASTRAIASSGHVVKSSSEKSESSCSSEVLMRIKRTKKIYPASMERFTLRRSVRSGTRPNRYHSKYNSPASR
ncbi:hypothetical protein PHMEG_00014819 [Phytophthora megakarya]|uniref:Uncharacterized protein n=1 Tax=Phytophthora megakarya TaxID=4795 RepID=A0A225W2T6_9STRA|nr:hypothetical protein PHMEG_00014819 [Phytophthora megakarya]